MSNFGCKIQRLEVKPRNKYTINKEVLLYRAGSKDRDLQNNATASARTAIALASGKRVEKLIAKLCGNKFRLFTHK